MLEKIKKILIEELEIYDADKIQNDLEIVETELIRLKEDFESKKKLIEQFEKQKKLKREISYYSFMEKNFTKRKEYIKYKKEAEKFNKEELEALKDEVISIEDRIKKLEEQKKELEEQKQKTEKNSQRKEYILNANSLNDLGLTFEEALKLLKDNNVDFLLTEDDKNIPNNNTDLNNPENLILIHKTNYAPNNNRVLSSYKNGGHKKIPLKIFGKKTSYEIPKTVDTIHFCVNGEVTSHAYGNFDNRKYAIIVPFEKATKYGTTLKTFRSEDTFFDGVVDLTGCYILCPKDEVQEVSKSNPNVNVIGYEGEYVDDFASAFIRLLGYESVKIEPYAGKQPNYILDSNNNFRHYAHSKSSEEYRDDMIAFYYRIINFIIFLTEYKNNFDFSNGNEDFYDFIYNVFSQNKYCDRIDFSSRFIASISEFSRAAKTSDGEEKFYLRELLTDINNLKQNDSSLLYFYEVLERDFNITLSNNLKKLISLSNISLDSFDIKNLEIEDEKLKAVINKLIDEKHIKDINDIKDLLFLVEVCTQVFNLDLKIGRIIK